MRRCMKKPHSLKLRHYAVCLIGFNEYLASFRGATMSYKMCVTELNTILLKSMPDIFSKQAYVQGFDCEAVSFKRAADIFDYMEMSESVNEDVVPPSY